MALPESKILIPLALPNKVMRAERKRNKKPWPTKDAMDQIYSLNLWGGDPGEFYSGEGSNHPNLVEPYIAEVKAFLSSFDEKPVVCDLGCGDFNIGKQLLDHCKQYKAADVVEELIVRNQEKFTHPALSFYCLDIAQDELPAGNVAILRQVLQHISNAEIAQVIGKLKQYDYVILTEHLPEGDFTPNVDIISGQGIRLKKKSGVDLLSPPFNLKIIERKALLSIPLEKGKGVVKTFLYML